MIRRLRPSLRLTTLTLPMIAWACGNFVTELSDRMPLEPLPVYAEWWVETESCSGRTGDLAAISWYTATGITSDGALASGLWRPPHDIILLLGREDDEFVVRHEMLHDLLGGDPGHASAHWATCELAPG